MDMGGLYGMMDAIIKEILRIICHKEKF